MEYESHQYFVSYTASYGINTLKIGNAVLGLHQPIASLDTIRDTEATILNDLRSNGESVDNVTLISFQHMGTKKARY